MFDYQFYSILTNQRIIFSFDPEKCGSVKLHETLPTSVNRPQNDWRLKVRKERAKKVDLSKKPPTPHATINLKPERVSILKDILSEKHGKISKGALTDYVAIDSKGANREVFLTFRSPDQLAYSEARAMSMKNKSVWKSAASKLLTTDIEPVCVSKGTQTVQVNKEDFSSSNPGTHSQLYFYRYLTALKYEEMEQCTYIRRRKPLDERGGKRGETGKQEVLTHQPQRMFLFRPPVLKQQKPGILRRQQSKNLLSALND